MLFFVAYSYGINLFFQGPFGEVKASTDKNPLPAKNIFKEIISPFKKDSFKDFVSNSRSVKVVDLKSNKTLFEKNAEEKVQIASLTKLMTAIMTYKNKDTSEVITIPAISYQTGETIMGLKAKEKLKIDDLIHATLISSAGDAAQALAINIAGSEEKFVEMMNEEAKKIGLKNTSFSNPVGYDDIKNYSTANDLLLLSRLFLSYDYLRNIVSKQTYIAKNEAGKEYYLKNTNRLLDGAKVFGIKTGYTAGAGECLITLVKKENHEILIIILGSSNRFDETNNLINWVFENWEWRIQKSI